jgi:hypothetical protein
VTNYNPLKHKKPLKYRPIVYKGTELKILKPNLTINFKTKPESKSVEIKEKYYKEKAAAYTLNVFED